MMLKSVKLASAVFVASVLSGCVGSNAVTEKVMEVNVGAVDNRYARAGLNMLMAPVYGIAISVDYLVVNSMEFWTGENPISGKPHIFDAEVDTLIEINDQLDKTLTEAPLQSNNKMIESGVLYSIDENTVKMEITYNTSETATLTGVKSGDSVIYYIDGQPVAQTTMAQLEAFTNASVS